MGDNGTRHSQRAAAGLSKAIRREYVPPDTQVVGPDGTVRFLGRRSEALDPVISFQKYNPARRDARSGKRPKPGAAAGAAAAAAAARRGGAGNALPFGRSARADGGGPLGGLLRGPMDFLNRVPFMHLVLTAALTHRVWTFVTRRFFGSGGAAAAAAARNGDRQLAKRPGGGEDEEYDDDEYDLDERAEELLEQMQHASMLPTMLRAALPRPHRTSLAKRAAQQYHSRPRGYRTAHQMAHGGPAAPAGASGGGGGGAGGRPAGDGAARRQAQRRPLGKLEKMDLIVRQQVRAAMLAQQRQQEQLLQQQLLGGALEAGPSAGARIALPGPAGVPSAAAAAASSSAAAPSAGRRVPLPPPPPPPYSNAGSGPLVPAAAAAAFPAPPHVLQPGPPPPPAYRPLPPELLARMKGVRHPRAAALAPAARAAAAGPPPAGLQDAQAASSASGGGSSAAATSAAAVASESGAGVAVAGTGEPSGRGQGQADAAASGSVAVVEGGSEDAEARPVVPRVARGVRSARKAEGQGNGSET